MFRSLTAHYNFRVWIAGLIISNLGVWMQRTAQDWIVLTELTDHNATAVGLTTALQFAPQLVLVAITGSIADRFDKRKILAITQSIMAVLAVVLTVLTVLGMLELWMMFALSLGLGIATAFDIPARQAFVVEIVSKDNLTNAISLNSAGFNLARLVGPGLAGVLVGVIGSGPVFALNAASFLAVLISLIAIRTRELRTIERRDEGKDKFRQGLRYLRTRPDIVVSMVAMFIFGAFGLQTPIIIATMTSVEFGLEAEVFGVLGSLVALGSLIGALIVARFQTVRLSIFIAAGLFICAANVAAALAPTVWAYGIVLVFGGIGTMTLIASAGAYVQSSVDEAYLGRVMAIHAALFIGATPIGAPVVGGITDAFGPRIGSLVTAGAGLAVAILIAVWLLVASGARLQRHPDRRFRLRVVRPERYSEGAAEEIATAEIALGEAETRRL